ncbi:MAG: S-layer homology domain-containing protein [Vulcanimicrobiota bacterium]
MRKIRLMVMSLIVALTLPLYAAPLFPDVPDAHWGRDAVAALAAKGLVEGYPDGTFKGDRAASRWEVAMIVARLLAKWSRPTLLSQPKPSGL